MVPTEARWSMATQAHAHNLTGTQGCCWPAAVLTRSRFIFSSLDRGGQEISPIGDGGRPEGLTRMWEGSRTTQQDPTADGIQAKGGREEGQGVRMRASVV